MKTTLNAIKAKRPCADGYRTLLKFLGKTEADDDPLALSTILKSNSVPDAVWCFRAVSGYDKEKRLFAVFCARQVQYLLTDPRSIAAIDVSERYANGNATNAELKNAYIAAYDAYWDIERNANYVNAVYAAEAAANAAFAAHSSYYAAYSDGAYYTTYSDVILAELELMPVLESYLKNLLSETEK